MADVKTEKQKIKEITDKLEEGLKELFKSLLLFRLIALYLKFSDLVFRKNQKVIHINRFCFRNKV